MSSPLFPQFYLIRPESKQTATSGKVTYPIVPLIPADQLPEWLEIVGVPRTLHHQQASKLSSVGIVPRDAGFYNVQIMGSDPSHPPPPSFLWAEAAPSAPVPAMSEAEEHVPWPMALSGLAPLEDEPIVQDQGEDAATTSYSPPSSPSIQLDAISSHDTAPTQSTSSTPLPDSREEPNHQDSPADSITDDQAPLPPSEQPQPQKHDKEQPLRSYCHHWCIHGVCKWGPRCRFLHEMPKTPEGFTSVGLTGYPHWYTDLMRKLDFTKGPDQASRLLHMKANAAPQHCRARRKGDVAHLQDGYSSAVLTPRETKQAQAVAVSIDSHTPVSEKRNYRQQRVGKTRPGVGLGGEEGKNGGSMMEQLTRSLSGIDLGSGTTDGHQAAVPGRLAKPERSPLYQRRPPIRTRGSRDYILIAGIGDGEPIALGGSKIRDGPVIKQVVDDGREGRSSQGCVPALQTDKYEGGKNESSQEKVANAMRNEKVFSNGKRMSKRKWNGELERRGKEKAPEKGVGKADLGGVDLLTFSDSE